MHLKLHTPLKLHLKQMQHVKLESTKNAPTLNLIYLLSTAFKECLTIKSFPIQRLQVSLNKNLAAAYVLQKGIKKIFFDLIHLPPS